MPTRFYTLGLLRRGFTLVELLVSITILSLLVTFVTLNFSQLRAEARDEIRINDLRQIQMALSAYKAEYGHFPRESEGYSGDGLAGIICTDASVCTADRLDTPINRVIREFMGPGVRDPLHNEGAGERYWYYYDGVKNCLSTNHAVTLHARTMETESFQNVDDFIELCPRIAAGEGGEGGGINEGTAHVIVLEYLPDAGPHANY